MRAPTSINAVRAWQCSSQNTIKSSCLKFRTMCILCLSISIKLSRWEQKVMQRSPLEIPSSILWFLYLISLMIKRWVCVSAINNLKFEGSSCHDTPIKLSLRTIRHRSIKRMPKPGNSMIEDHNASGNQALLKWRRNFTSRKHLVMMTSEKNE